jgi:hypothetical protein
MCCHGSLDGAVSAALDDDVGGISAVILPGQSDAAFREDNIE